MELTQDMIYLQTIFKNLTINIGDISTINYIGGNESRVSHIAQELQTYLTNKKYLIENQINMEYEQVLRNIVKFLIVNTKFKRPVKIEELDHLKLLEVPLTKCCLVNVMWQNKLFRLLCDCFKDIPVEVVIEFLDEIITLLDKNISEDRLDNAYYVLKAISSVIEPSLTQENLDKLMEAVDIVIMSMTGSYQSYNISKETIYCNIGKTLLLLYKLLLDADLEENCLTKFLECVLRTCCNLVQSVTLDVFCTWAELDVEEETLQSKVAKESYFILQKFIKYEPAKELTGMLQGIARKPKSISEQIQEADLETMIKNVNNSIEKSIQFKWFQALLSRKQWLTNDKLINCVERHYKLCNEDNVNCLLNIDSNSKVQKLALKCAGNLELKKLLIVLARQCYDHSLDSPISENIEPQLLLIFNKLTEINCSNEEIMKEIVLQMLLNFNQTINYMLKACIQNSMYSNRLKYTFEQIQNVVEMHGLNINFLNNLFSLQKIDSDNYNNYLKLFNMLVEVKFVSSKNLIEKIIKKFILNNNDSLKEIYFILLLVRESGLEEALLLEVLFPLMKSCRCKLINFEQKKINVLEQIVLIISSLDKLSLTNFSLNNESNDLFYEYYKKKLIQENSLLLKGNFRLIDHTQRVMELIKILPLCVSTEFLTISEEVENQLTPEDCVEILTDTIFLISETAKTQEANHCNSNILQGLKYHTKNYGLVIKKLLNRQQTVELEMKIAQNVVRLLSQLPASLKSEMGMSLLHLLPDRCLKALNNNKQFLCNIVALKQPELAKYLTQKMLK